jgi:hypothetical protein
LIPALREIFSKNFNADLVGSQIVRGFSHPMQQMPHAIFLPVHAENI